ncbi:MAG: hypothetical protein R3F14_09920 [Polyangiaceae bacterium]
MAGDFSSGALTSAAPDILASHGFDSESAAALRAHDHGRMLEARDRWLTPFVNSFLDGHARWQENDRPSLGELVGEPDEDGEYAHG